MIIAMRGMCSVLTKLQKIGRVMAKTSAAGDQSRDSLKYLKSVSTKVSVGGVGVGVREEQL